MKDFEVLFFDADNTLFDFNEAEKKALSNIFHEFSHPFSEVHLWTYREINRELWKGFEQGTVKPDTIKTERFAQLARVFSMDIDVEKTAKEYLCFLGEEHQLMPNAYEVVAHFNGKIRMAILTNGLSSVQNNRFRKSEIGPYISDIFISEEIGYQKPQKEIFDYAMASMKVMDRKKVLMVGDSLHSDILGGIQAGISTCWYNPENSMNPTGIHADHEINDLKELLELLG